MGEAVELLEEVPSGRPSLLDVWSDEWRLETFFNHFAETL